MDENTDQHKQLEEPGSSGPPIQWPINSHQMGDDAKLAADLARQQVQRAHIARSTRHVQPPPRSQPTVNQHPTPEPAQQPHTMRNEEFDWPTYHREWQHYYHRYFYQYYANWWLQQKAYQQVSRQNAQEQPPETQDEAKKRLAAETRAKIRTTITTSAKKVKSSSHFKPVIAGLTAGLLFLFVNYNQIMVGAVKQYVAPGNVVTTPVIIEADVDGKVSKAPRLIIPKIGVDVPVVYDEPKVDEDSYQKALERGVVRLGNTANPGTNGNVVIGGHSSNNVFNAGDFKYVFVNLKRLDKGDVFYLNYNGQRYTYKIIVAKKIITPKDVSALASTGKPIVTLFTCDPPGTNVNRLIVQAQQVDPDPNQATAQNKSVEVNKANPLPSVAPSIWDRLFGN